MIYIIKVALIITISLICMGSTPYKNFDVRSKFKTSVPITNPHKDVNKEYAEVVEEPKDFNNYKSYKGCYDLGTGVYAIVDEEKATVIDTYFGIIREYQTKDIFNGVNEDTSKAHTMYIDLSTWEFVKKTYDRYEFRKKI